MAKFVRYIEVLFRTLYILLLLGKRKLFVIPRTSLYRGSLYRGIRYIEVCYIKAPLYEEYPTVLSYKFPTHLKARAIFNFPLVREKGFLGSSGI